LSYSPTTAAALYCVAGVVYGKTGFCQAAKDDDFAGHVNGWEFPTPTFQSANCE